MMYECEDTCHSMCGLRATFRSCFSSSTLFRQGLFCSSHTTTPGSLAHGFLDDYPVSISHLAAALSGLQVCATMSFSLHGSQVLEPCIGYFSVAVIKYLEPKQFAEMKVSFSLQFIEVESLVKTTFTHQLNHLAGPN